MRPSSPVRAGRECVGGAELAAEPQLAGLWEEARKGVAQRRAFEGRWRFVRVSRQDGTAKLRLQPNRRFVRLDTLRSEPDSVPVRDERQRALNRAQGYGERNLLTVPNEKELLDPAFLEEHCLESAVRDGDGATAGALGVRFRPAAVRRDGYGIRGTVWLDAESYLVRRIDYEHLDGGDPFSRVIMDYRDVMVQGQALRLPAGGFATISLRGPSRIFASRANVVITLDYSGFAEGPGR